MQFLCVLILGQQAQPQSAAANKSIYYYERSGSNSPQIAQQYHHQMMQRDHLASDSLVLNATASSKYVNLPSGGSMYMHNASSSLPAANVLPPKFNRQLQSPSKDYVQINPPAMYANQSPIPPPSQGTQSPSRSISRSYQHQVNQSPTKSISSAGSRAAMEDINGSDYVCMSGGTLTKKLQQEKGQSLPATQVIYQRPPPVPPLKTNYTTPANELPQAQYSTAADKQIDAIAVAKKSVNLNKIASVAPSTTTSPTPLAMAPGKGSKLLLLYLM
jgi:hypothetical protein